MVFLPLNRILKMLSFCCTAFILSTPQSAFATISDEAWQLILSNDGGSEHSQEAIQMDSVQLVYESPAELPSSTIEHTASSATV